MRVKSCTPRHKLYFVLGTQWMERPGEEKRENVFYRSLVCRGFLSPPIPSHVIRFCVIKIVFFFVKSFSTQKTVQDNKYLYLKLFKVKLSKIIFFILKNATCEQLFSVSTCLLKYNILIKLVKMYIPCEQFIIIKNKLINKYIFFKKIFSENYFSQQ